MNGLVAKGYLAPGDRDDIAAIESAIDSVMHDWLISTGQ
jgi:hypothetical protein